MRGLNSRWQTVLVLIMVSPLLTSVVVRTLAWVVFCCRGAASSIRSSTHSACPRSRLMYNETAVVVALTHVFFGYMVISLSPSCGASMTRCTSAASNLGASRSDVRRDHAAAQPSGNFGRMHAGVHARGQRLRDAPPRWLAARGTACSPSRSITSRSSHSPGATPRSATVLFVLIAGLDAR